MEQIAGVQGDSGGGVEKEDAGRGFAGEVSGDGFYGNYEGCTALADGGYWFDASDTGSYQGV